MARQWRIEQGGISSSKESESSLSEISTTFCCECCCFQFFQFTCTQLSDRLDLGGTAKRQYHERSQRFIVARYGVMVSMSDSHQNKISDDPYVRGKLRSYRQLALTLHRCARSSILGIVNLFWYESRNSYLDVPSSSCAQQTKTKYYNITLRLFLPIFHKPQPLILMWDYAST